MPGSEYDLGAMTATAVKPDEFRQIQSLAHSVFGLDLKSGKEALVSARLGKRVRDLGLRDIAEYLDRVKADHTGIELASLIDALTTNFTSFLREPDHFQVMRDKILPALAARPSFHIWSAGCSTGEEPYTILFHIADALGDGPAAARGLNALHLMATDISTRALEAASAGKYAEGRLAEMPDAWRRRFFQRGTGAQQGQVRVKQEWRARVQFERLNLMEDFSHRPQCALIFCRNVMIYFDKQTQERLVQRFTERLEPGGWLFIGHSEGLMGVKHQLEYVKPAVYRKPQSGH